MRQHPPELDRFHISEIAEVCHVSLKTAARWKYGSTCPPATALMVLSRDLGFLDPDWRGWTISAGQIISPDGWTVSRNDALSVPLMFGQISALRRDLASAREALDEATRIEEQPKPADWSISDVK